MSIDSLRRDVISAIDALKGELIGISHAIHSEPEISLQEFKASARLADAASEHGMAVTREAYGMPTAFATEFGKADGPTIAILSEYDALPGIGHACGHNVIAAIGYGAAVALSKIGLPGKVRYLGTPAEEAHGGKELMARHGAFDGVDAAMMIHPANMNLMTMPTIAVADVEAIYHGKAAHASAMPFRGLNALDAVITAYSSIAQLRQHIRNSERIHGIITDGGMAPNIVPERAACRFFIRAPDVHDLTVLKKRVVACFEAGALATGCRLELKWTGADYLDLKTNWPLAEEFQKHAEALGRQFFKMEDIPQGFAGSTDMGNVSHRVPSIHPMLAVAPSDVIIHHPDFAHWAAADAGDQAVLDGAKALALTALDMMADTHLLVRVKSDFAASAELSRLAVQEVSHQHHHGGCGCC
ncbi:amidohydrolase [Rhizomicrobium palustre]|uniref:Peptidase M20 domain-containing protein 2 n=1 Tax=Rhizomicrobium palustre TaxID=189966 RepID=A0A846MV80_9PROT|nr:M20 family metallopeptidase [Rhizomicrobium palustre]NIK87364.1 amidohydrolase [Rhizomicrobium palustre]